MLDILLNSLPNNASQTVNEEITLYHFPCCLYYPVCTIHNVTWHGRVKDPKKFTIEDVERVANALTQISHLTTNPKSIFTCHGF